jgi:hypothetical protein
MGLNVGTSSIMMLFVVLCLTVLAVLSLLSANSQMTMTLRAANSVSAYYAADTKAAEIYDAVVSGDITGVTVKETDVGFIYSYTVPIDEHQTLAVELFGDILGQFVVNKWKIVEADDWVPEDVHDLWDGSFS